MTLLGGQGREEAAAGAVERRGDGRNQSHARARETHHALAQRGRGGIENKHSTDIESPSPPPLRFSMSVHPEGKSVSHVPSSVECLLSTTLHQPVLKTLGQCV